MITVYLCGGINGLTDAAAKNWRKEATARLDCRILDPMRRDYRGKEALHVNDIVHGDFEDIALADVILVNASRPSWGTAMEIYHASLLGKRVVAFGAGDNPSPWLIYHCDLLAPTFSAALEAIV